MPEYIIICDFPHSNYQLKPYDSNILHLFSKAPPKASITKHLKSKTKTSELSRSYGEIATSKYLSEEHALELEAFYEKNKILIDSCDLVICMGSVSSKLFTNLSIRKSIGRLHEINGKKIYATWHPNQIFSSFRIRRDFMVHMEDIQRLIKQTLTDDVEVEFSRTKDVKISDTELSRILADSNITIISVDTETSAHKHVDIISVDFGDHDEDGNRITYWMENPSINVADNIFHGRHIVFQKGTYDIPFLMDNYNLDLTKITWDDISYMSRFFEPDQFFRLEEIEKRYVGTWEQWKQFKGRRK